MGIDDFKHTRSIKSFPPSSNTTINANFAQNFFSRHSNDGTRQDTFPSLIPFGVSSWRPISTAQGTTRSAQHCFTARISYLRDVSMQHIIMPRSIPAASDSRIKEMERRIQISPLSTVRHHKLSGRMAAHMWCSGKRRRLPFCSLPLIHSQRALTVCDVSPLSTKECKTFAIPR